MAVKLYRGDTFLRSWLLTDSNNAVIDLTGATARLYIRDARLAIVAEASTATGEITITGNLGKIELRIESVVTALFVPGTYKFDLELTDSGGVVMTIESANLKVLQDVTYDD